MTATDAECRSRTSGCLPSADIWRAVGYLAPPWAPDPGELLTQAALGPVAPAHARCGAISIAARWYGSSPIRVWRGRLATGWPGSVDAPCVWPLVASARLIVEVPDVPHAEALWRRSGRAPVGVRDVLEALSATCRVARHRFSHVALVLGRPPEARDSEHAARLRDLATPAGRTTIHADSDEALSTILAAILPWSDSEGRPRGPDLVRDEVAVAGVAGAGVAAVLGHEPPPFDDAPGVVARCRLAREIVFRDWTSYRSLPTIEPSPPKRFAPLDPRHVLPGVVAVGVGAGGSRLDHEVTGLAECIRDVHRRAPPLSVVLVTRRDARPHVLRRLSNTLPVTHTLPADDGVLTRLAELAMKRVP